MRSGEAGDLAPGLLDQVARVGPVGQDEPAVHRSALHRLERPPVARPDHAVDVTDVVDRKFAALSRHVTQVSHQPEGQLEEFVTAWMRQTAQRFGLADGRLAESFHVVHTA